MASDAAKKYFDRGLAFFHRNEHEKASELFKKAVFEDPDYPEALYNLASCQAVLGEEEDAFIYLDRASKLNPQCLTWAKEDSEYDNLRDDDRFTKIFQNNDILNMPSSSAEVEEEPYIEEVYEEPVEMLAAMPMEQPVEGMPKFEDHTGISEKTIPPKNNLPNCTNCGGILEEQFVPKYPIFFSMGMIILGTIISIMLLSAISIIIGVPIIIAGFYMFMQNVEEWVCLACGARGKKAGQKTNTKKRKATTKPQSAN